MKNNQKGSVLTVILIIIVILVVIIGGLFFITSSSLNSARSQNVQTSTNTEQSQVSLVENQKQYSDPSGLFSFTYPSDLEITKYTPTNGLTEILSQYPFYTRISQKTSQGNDDFSVAVDLDDTTVANFEKAGQTDGIKNFSKENVTIGNLKGYRVYFERTIFGKTVQEATYVVPLVYNTSKVILSEKIVAWNPTWLSKMEPVARSIKIDVTKTPLAEDKLKNSPIIQAMQQADKRADLRTADNEVISLMSQIQRDAEISYSTHQSYSSLCTTSTNFNQVKDKTNNKVKCSAGGDYYVVSAQLPSGIFYCLDNTGSSSKTTALHTGASCLK